MKAYKNVFGKNLPVLFISILIFILTTQLCIAGELYNKKSGLPSQTAKRIYVSNDKVLFAGDIDGLMVYDKQTGEFKGYTQKNNKYLSKVHCAIEAFDKIWVGTELALLTIDEDGNINEIRKIETPSITRKGTMNEPIMVKVQKLFYEDGYLWVSCYGVSGGLYRYDGNEWEEIRFGLSPFNYCTDIKVVGDNIWYGTISFGIYLYNKKSKEWRTLNSGAKDTLTLPNDTIISLAFVKGNIWAGTSDSVIEISKDEKEYKFDMVVHDAKSTGGKLNSSGNTYMASSEEGDVYVSSLEGIAKYSGGSWESIDLTDKNDKVIPVRRIYTLQVDGDSVWVASDKGIIKID